MQASTVAILDRINRDFYRDRAAEFSATRGRPWSGWDRLLDLVAERSERPSNSTGSAILDLGCGNGRLLPRLMAKLGSEISYLGVDLSSPLLAQAASRGEAIEAAFVAADVVADPLAALGARARFDLVTAFGLLHHVAGLDRRRKVLLEAARRLRPGGWLAVSFWQFGRLERFERRFMPWSELAGRDSIDESDLEPGDHLLAWGEAGAVRYCHHASPDEADALMRGTGLVRVARFYADGKTGDLNLYHLWRREPRPG